VLAGNNAGGIRTFANVKPKKGSGADFAAYALGYIQGTEGDSDGFYSANLSTDTPPNYASLMFANNLGINLGGLLGGQLIKNHCTKDYFNDTRLGDLGAPQNSGQITLNGKATGQYLYKDNGGGLPCLRIKGTVDAGARVTIYTSDDVCINDDITYAPWDIDHIPYLAVITTGNIYVQPNVNTITGLFISQPLDRGGGNVTGGAFTTCADGAGLASAGFISSNCQGQLTIKGSVIAQNVYPTRARDTDTLWRYANTSNSSEIFDFIPSMVVGQPNLAPTCGGAAVSDCQNNIKTLPPVF
jgi:hypothetical protein